MGLPNRRLALYRKPFSQTHPRGRNLEVRDLERDVFREQSLEEGPREVARHDARCRAMDHRDRRRIVEREVLADVHRAVSRPNDDGMLCCECGCTWEAR